MKTIEIIDNPVTHRYEVRSDGDTAELAYEKRAGQTIFLHTQVPPAMGGQGIGSALARRALSDSLAEGRWQIPLCPFVRGYALSHPEVQDHPEYYQFLAGLKETTQELLLLARSMIIESVPEMVVEMPMPAEQMVGYAEKGGKFTDNLCSLAVRPEGLHLFIQEELAVDDPQGLIADGYVPIRAPKDVLNPQLRALIRAAWEAVE